MTRIKVLAGKLKDKAFKLDDLEDKVLDVLEGEDIDVGLSVLTKIMCSQALAHGIDKDKIIEAMTVTYYVFETILEAEAREATKH